MIQTEKLALRLPDIDDDVEQTVVWLSENMRKIDDSFEETIASIESHLVSGRVYESGEKFWNKANAVDSYVGWINLATGVYARKWEKGKLYAIGDVVVPNVNNGHYYECIAGGTSSSEEPKFLTASLSTHYDITGSSEWISRYNYNVGDIVVATNNSKLYYYKCIQKGITGNFEPNWTNVAGSTIVDGSVNWYIYKSVQWKEKGTSCNFEPFGGIGLNYKGQETIDTLGIISTGEWNAKTIGVAHGGTGGMNAKDARTNIGATGKYSVNIGDGVSTTFTVRHNLNTEDVVIAVREGELSKASVNFTSNVIDVNTITIKTSTVMSLNQLRVTVIG